MTFRFYLDVFNGCNFQVSEIPLFINKIVLNRSAYPLLKTYFSEGIIRDTFLRPLILQTMTCVKNDSQTNNKKFDIFEGEILINDGLNQFMVEFAVSHDTFKSIIVLKNLAYSGT